MVDSQLKIASKYYKTLFILEDRTYWYAVKDKYDKEHDLVLTIDFAVKKEVEEIGGTAEFLDHLSDPCFLNKVNYQMQNFIDNWFKVDGKDAFQYRGINFGNSFKLNILNDITYTVHFFTNIAAIQELNVERIICGVDDTLIKQLLGEFNIQVEYIKPLPEVKFPIYYFPIGKWMKEAIEKQSLKRKFFNYSLYLLESLKNYFQKSSLPFIYINCYHPTAGIVKRIKAEKKVNLVLNNYTSSRNLFQEKRVIFMPNKTHKLNNQYKALFYSNNRISLKINDIDLAPKLYKIIEPTILSNISKCLNSIDSIITYFEKKDFRLMIPVTDLWLENRLLMNYCTSRNIPVFMIINGLLTCNSYKDGFDSTWVNAFGAATKEDYYLNAPNIICLGDPRMDVYALCEKKQINYSEPTIVIGTSGYNPIDLNSYLAIEYDFLYDILSSLKHIQSFKKFNLIIKVRPNGYLERYNEFVREYFGEMKVQVVQNVSFVEVIKQADLYISIYSQTLLEAASLGIPSLYYKKDTETNNRPFDCKSELVTAQNTKELKEKIFQFYEDDNCYKSFMRRDVLEKYIGPLDGKNCERNVEFIYSLIK